MSERNLSYAGTKELLLDGAWEAGYLKFWLTIYKDAHNSENRSLVEDLVSNFLQWPDM